MHNSMIHGHTDNYIKVVLDGNEQLQNQIINVKLIKNNGDHIIGQI